jgi:putative DNA primase/helicase
MQVGEGGNGKGTLNDFMSNHIFGQQPDGYAAEIPIEALLEQRNDRHPTDMMQLFHARLVLARESDETSRWNEGRVKKLTGGDLITARYMRQDFVTFAATHTLIPFLNVPPVLKGGDQAAWKRRLHLILFQQLWADEADETKGIIKRDPQMGEKLAAEAPGILFKLIRAGVDWFKDRDLKAPDTVLSASKAYLVQQSTIQAYIADRCDLSSTVVTITVNELWTDYLAWCERNHDYPCKRQNFPDALERAGIKITRTSKERGICKGVKLKDMSQSATWAVDAAAVESLAKGQ